MWYCWKSRSCYRPLCRQPMLMPFIHRTMAIIIFWVITGLLSITKERNSVAQTIKNNVRGDICCHLEFGTIGFSPMTLKSALLQEVALWLCSPSLSHSALHHLPASKSAAIFPRCWSQATNGCLKSSLRGLLLVCVCEYMSMKKNGGTTDLLFVEIYEQNLCLCEERDKAKEKVWQVLVSSIIAHPDWERGAHGPNFGCESVIWPAAHYFLWSCRALCDLLWYSFLTLLQKRQNIGDTGTVISHWWHHLQPDSVQKQPGSGATLTSGQLQL